MLLTLSIFGIGIFILTLLWEAEEKQKDTLPIFGKAILVLLGFCLVLFFPFFTGLFVGILAYKIWVKYKALTR